MPGFPSQCSLMNSRKSLRVWRFAARVMRCVDLMCLLIRCLWKGLDPGMTPNLFHHTDVVPARVERIQYPIMDRPGASSHRVCLVPVSEGQVIVQALVQPATRPE